MYLKTITPPASLAVSVDEAKAHLRIESADEDSVLEGFVKAAIARLDGILGEAGLALMPQTVLQALDYFPDADFIPLALSNTTSITSLQYLDTEGVWQVWDSANYTLENNRLYLGYGQSWPSVLCRQDSIKITFVAGFADSASIPQDLKQSVLLMAGQYYEYRENMSDYRRSILPCGVQEIIERYNQTIEAF